MSFKFDLYGKVTACLQSRPETRLTPKEIAAWIFENYREACEQKRKRAKQDLSADDALIQQISAQIKPKNFRKNNKIRKTDKPRRFYWTEKTDAIGGDENSASVAENRQTELKEAALYPILQKFLLSKKIYSKRIDEKCSSNKRGKGGNKGLHPDIVGLEDSNPGWCDEIKKCAGAFFYKTVTLSSYEVKRKLNSSNISEAFSQAVSNSFWANYGYLVAAKIDDKIEPELRRLANLHGIGVICLDNNPARSRIILKSKKRNIDWDTVNRISEENTDFMDYIICVRETITNGRIKEADWYQTPKPED